MTSLTVIESGIISRLLEIEFMSAPMFRAVRGVSGPVSPAVLSALRREKTPAASVIFINERLDPGSDPDELGPRFSILLADRALRQTQNARHGDPPSPGVFEMLRRVRDVLDDADLDDYTLIPIAQNALASDDRFAVIQLTYLARPK